MAVTLYKPGAWQNVEPHLMQNELDAGWALDERVMTGEAVEDETSDTPDLEAARELYKEKFGEAPHHKMKLETIMEKLNEPSVSE